MSDDKRASFNGSDITGANIPLPGNDDDLVRPASLLRPNSPAFRESAAFTSNTNLSYGSAHPIGAGIVDSHAAYNKEATGQEADAAQATEKPRKSRRTFMIILAGVALIIIIAIAVAIPLALKSKSKSSSSTSSSSGSNSGNNNGPSDSGSNSGSSSGSVVYGVDGTTVTTETGSTFTYSNKFGGYFVTDSDDPFNSNARAQSWTPPLNQSWDWQNDRIRGVNLGGWLVPEPFIVPALYEKYLDSDNPPHDEWDLSLAMAKDTAGGGINQLETHYKTFITEEDFAQIAGAGLNWVRLPIPFWAVQSYPTAQAEASQSGTPGEPFLANVSWTYILKAFQWARKYGIRINLDLHTAPGSQNGFNHSGKGGQINWLYGPMGVANAQRTLDYLRVITEFISQKEYANVVPMLGLVNEVLTSHIGKDVATAFYLEAHDVLRNITGYGAGNGPFLSVHDGFQGLDTWADFLPGADRIALDKHPYLVFRDQISEQPLHAQIQTPCRSWASELNTSWTDYGVSVAGEWSLAINDCGLWINGVNAGSRWDGDIGGGTNTRGTGANSCADWNDYENWSDSRKADFVQFGLASMDALQNWFFWTWKIGASSRTGKVETPMWSYQLGLENNYMPLNPADSVGMCDGGTPASPLKPIMTGGAGAGQISNAIRNQFAWPPTGIQPGNWDGSNMPQYTQTGSIPVLPTPTFSNAKVQGGNGWADANDVTPIFTPIAGCDYLDAWDSETAANPGPCSGSTRRRRNNVPAMPKRTPPPM